MLSTRDLNLPRRTHALRRWLRIAGAEEKSAGIRSSRTAHLLSIYDEYISGYKDRSAIVASRHDGQIVGTWRRTLSAKAVNIETRLFDPLRRAGNQAVAAAARRYGEFLGLPVVFG